MSEHKTLFIAKCYDPTECFLGFSLSREGAKKCIEREADDAEMLRQIDEDCWEEDGLIYSIETKPLLS